MANFNLIFSFKGEAYSSKGSDSLWTTTTQRSLSSSAWCWYCNHNNKLLWFFLFFTLLIINLDCPRSANEGNGYFRHVFSGRVPEAMGWKRSNCSGKICIRNWNINTRGSERGKKKNSISRVKIFKKTWVFQFKVKKMFVLFGETNIRRCFLFSLIYDFNSWSSIWLEEKTI